MTDDGCVDFHSYTVCCDGVIIGKNGKPLKSFKSRRNGGGFCMCVQLYYGGKAQKWRIHRLVAACFLGNIHGYEVNHKDRNTENNDISNLEIVTPKENQNHWRKDYKQR